MTRYSDSFRVAVVEEWLKGDQGPAAIAKRYGIERSHLRRWVALYEQHGEDGLTKKKYVYYTAELKLLVLQHMRDTGQSYLQTAAHFNIRGLSNLKKWEERYRSGGYDALVNRFSGGRKKVAAPTRKPDLGPPKDDQRSREELIAELEYLRMENEYLKKLKALVQARQKAGAPKKSK